MQKKEASIAGLNRLQQYQVMNRMTNEVIPEENDFTDTENFEDITAELRDYIADKLEPMEIIKKDAFDWEEALNASELCHPKMDTRLQHATIANEKRDLLKSLEGKLTNTQKFFLFRELLV